MYDQKFPPGAQALEPHLEAPPPAIWRRPEAWMATAAFVAGIALSSMSVRPHDHPAGAVRRWAAALARGDVATLRRDGSLGSRVWMDGLVHELGEADYQRVLGIYQRSGEAGIQELERLRSAMRDGGVSAFERLDQGQQQAVNRQSHDQWVCARGLSRVPEAATAGGCAGLLAEPPAPQLLERLGTAGLDADEQALLGARAASDPAVRADPMLARLAERRAEEGVRALARLRERVWREGEREMRQLPREERAAIDRRSRERFMLDRGFASLSAADRGRLGSTDAILDESGALADRLGLQALDAPARREIEGRRRSDFIAAHSSFVDATGARLAHDLLVTEYGAAKLDLADLAMRGVGGRDLIRRRVASATLRWTRVGSGLRRIPREVTARWSSRDAAWNIAEVRWAERAEAGGDTPTYDPANTDLADAGITSQGGAE